MIQLTAGQAQTYEMLKTGEFSATQIGRATGRSHKTVSSQIEKLVLIGFAERVGARRKALYKGLEGSYELLKQNTRGTYNKLHDTVFLEGEADVFLHELVNVRLSEEQTIYLQNHRQEKRSVLAKELGIPKIQLNLAMERLG